MQFDKQMKTLRWRSPIRLTSAKGNARTAIFNASRSAEQSIGSPELVRPSAERKGLGLRLNGLWKLSAWLFYWQRLSAKFLG
jgi:hypothetical protein